MKPFAINMPVLQSSGFLRWFLVLLSFIYVFGVESQDSENEDSQILDADIWKSIVPVPVPLVVSDLSNGVLVFEIAKEISPPVGILEILYGASLNDLMNQPVSIAQIPVGQIRENKVEIILGSLAGNDSGAPGFFRGQIVNDHSGPEIQVYSPGMHTHGIEEIVAIRGRVRDNDGISEFLVNGKPLDGIHASQSDWVEWSVEIPMRIGTNIIELQARDRLNNTTVIQLQRERLPGIPSQKSILVDFEGRLQACEAIRLIWMEPGSFLMGTPQGENGSILDEFQHAVILTQGYWLAETEVTYRQWHALMGQHHYSWKNEFRESLPISGISWTDCMAFCARLTELEQEAGRLASGMVYTLPTEAQWEFACREGGTATGPFHYGATIDSTLANFDGRYPYTGSERNIFRNWTVPVRSFLPNASGFYDMHGNVSEFCQDTYAHYPRETVYNPLVVDERGSRVLRGGSFSNQGRHSRSASRLLGNTSSGFRVSLQADRMRSGDLSGPIIEVLSPGLGTQDTQESIVIQGRVSDLSGVARFRINGQVLENIQTSSADPSDWNFTLPMQLGKNIINLDAMDNFNNVSSLEISYERTRYMPVNTIGIVDFGGVVSVDEAIHMVWVDPGTFLMGSPSGEAGREVWETQRHVTLTQGFWIGESEVTQAQWMAIMDFNPGFFRGNDSLPVENVSWQDAMEFCERLNERERLAGRLPENMIYTLPTEAQWEFACRERGLAVWPFHFGSDLDSSQANFNGNFPYGAGQAGINRERPTSVKSFQSNSLGLFDMHGNVGEWCRDGFSSHPSTDAITDPYTVGTFRHVIRGGSYASEAVHTRSASRSASPNKSKFTGFRLSLQMR